jgi:hypothetical protein
MNYKENIVQLNIARERINNELDSIFLAFPPEYRDKCLRAAARAHSDVYRPYLDPALVMMYDRDFWQALELRLPWQRDLRVHLKNLNGIGDSTVNRLYRMALGRSPNNHKGRPSVRGWASIAATIRENPAELKNTALSRHLTPIPRQPLITIRTELMDWYLS